MAAVKIKMEVDAETKIEVETDAHAERAGASDRKALKSHESAEHVEEWRYAAVTVSVLALASSPPPLSLALSGSLSIYLSIYPSLFLSLCLPPSLLPSLSPSLTL